MDQRFPTCFSFQAIVASKMVHIFSPALHAPKFPLADHLPPSC
jgi:hypothetical protein